MRIHFLQHEPHEGPGLIRSCLNDFSAERTVTRFFAGEHPPASSGVDALIVMGGSMGADDEKTFPWLAAEKDFIGSVIGLGRKVIGICLGAQLIARVLGAGVRKNYRTEIGFFPVRRDSGAALWPCYGHFPDEFIAFHWHGDTFDIPSGAVRTFTNNCTPNQGFHYGSSVCAFQFHIETGAEEIRTFVDSQPASRPRGRYVQTPEHILNFSGSETDTKPLLQTFLSRWLG